MVQSHDKPGSCIGSECTQNVGEDDKDKETNADGQDEAVGGGEAKEVVDIEQGAVVFNRIGLHHQIHEGEDGGYADYLGECHEDEEEHEYKALLFLPSIEDSPEFVHEAKGIELHGYTLRRFLT